MVQIATTEPTEVNSGDTLQWRREDLISDYPASAGWALNYYFRGPSAPSTISGVASGDAFAVTVPAATTATWNEGMYWWAARVSKAGEVFTVDTGVIQIKKNWSDADAVFDGRTHVKRTLDELEATIERLSGQDLAQYSIAQRTAVRQRLEILVPLRDQYAAKYKAEVDAASGQTRSHQVKVQFTR